MVNMKVILLGSPGVGKGTTARFLAGKFRLEHISTGEVLRAGIAAKTELGNKAREFVESGKLVPDELVTEIVKEKLNTPQAKKGFFLDGYPRTLAQARALKQFTEIDRVLNLSAPKKVVIERIKNRAEGRRDDSPEVIMQRIAEYEEKTKPLIDFYRNEGILSDIDSTQDVDGVVQQCIEVLEEG